MNNNFIQKTFWGWLLLGVVAMVSLSAIIFFFSDRPEISSKETVVIKGGTNILSYAKDKNIYWSFPSHSAYDKSSKEKPYVDHPNFLINDENAELKFSTVEMINYHKSNPNDFYTIITLNPLNNDEYVIESCIKWGEIIGESASEGCAKEKYTLIDNGVAKEILSIHSTFVNHLQIGWDSNALYLYNGLGSGIPPASYFDGQFKYLERDFNNESVLFVTELTNDQKLPANTQDTNWKLYSNSKVPFTINIPSDWTTPSESVQGTKIEISFKEGLFLIYGEYNDPDTHPLNVFGKLVSTIGGAQAQRTKFTMKGKEGAEITCRSQSCPQTLYDTFVVAIDSTGNNLIISNNQGRVSDDLFRQILSTITFTK